MSKATITFFLILLWLLLSQSIFYFVQRSQGIGYQHLISAQAREIGKSSDYFKLSQTISDLTNLGFIACSSLKMITPIYREIIDLRTDSDCEGLSKHSFALEGSYFKTEIVTLNGDRYELLFRTVNQPIFILSLWIMRLAGVILILSGAFYIGAQTKLQEERTRGERAVSEARYFMAEQLAHDIRSPLSALSLAASTLPPNLKSHRDIIIQTTTRVNKIAEDMLNQTKIETDAVFRETPVGQEDLTSLKSEIESLVNQKNIEYEKSRITFSTDLDNLKGNLSTNLRTKDLTSILSNICNNSAESMHAEGTVRLEGWISDRKVYIRISDTGKGIPKEILEKIGVARVTSKGAQGNGIGLLNAKRLLQEHNGDMAILSKPGLGTQITLLVPLKQK